MKFNKGGDLKTIINYVGQMRIYGIIDISVFALAVGCSLIEMIGVVLLWICFLLYLESIHRDALRLTIRRFVWLIVGIPTLFILPWWLPVAFMLAGYMYTKKKTNRFFGITSPLWRGIQGALIAVAFMPEFAFLAFVVYAIRNLIGDFRDIGDDWNNGTHTLPVCIGFRKNQTWAFWGHLATVIGTTLLWSWYADLNITIILLCVVGEIITYPLTPRQSNPPRFAFC
jgi:4-hydroxybenzoate polyprenyltransferase